ncbi:hypothetical protein STRIP9103_05801 [Streptomyces ipomoeae 91-03]|uniref:Uncharacterized protein n=1 Tax=Streptomyces ipomoeae 91-03 TaxID=698759 RepID=L1L2E6_9ACTN|nr:hypothetical protein STRIP9103_05801 [Streptomyces ipomoeae 91-03]
MAIAILMPWTIYSAHSASSATRRESTEVRRTTLSAVPGVGTPGAGDPVPNRPRLTQLTGDERTVRSIRTAPSIRTGSRPRVGHTGPRRKAA